LKQIDSYRLIECDGAGKMQPSWDRTRNAKPVFVAVTGYTIKTHNKCDWGRNVMRVVTFPLSVELIWDCEQ